MANLRFHTAIEMRVGLVLGGDHYHDFNCKLVFCIFRASSEFERNPIRERMMDGRPKALSAEQQRLLRRLYADEAYSISSICQMLKISKPTLYKYLD